MDHVYHGDNILFCPKVAYDLRAASAVIVSGDGLNSCGHTLLNTGGCAGWYFHVGDWHQPIFYMGAAGYARYLKETKKQELKRWKLNLPKPAAAMAKLMELMDTKWQWGGLPHNCVAFVEEVCRAGGSKAGMYLNCPRLEAFR